LGEFAHFLGDDRKALAGIAGARRLDAGIQRQQVGLEGDVVDDADDVGNLARRLFDLLPSPPRRCAPRAGLLGALLGLGDQLSGLVGAAAANR
jgi:hypothetical protein